MKQEFNLTEGIMKRRTGIWIDSSKAIIISLEGNKESITEIDSDIENRSHHHGEGKKGTFNGLRQGSNESQFDNKKREQTDYFMDTIIDYVKKSDELYVFGPSGAKTELKKRIERDHILSLIHISEPTRPCGTSRMPSSA